MDYDALLKKHLAECRRQSERMKRSRTWPWMKGKGKGMGGKLGKNKSVKR